jgi:hypothetical protein
MSRGLSKAIGTSIERILCDRYGWDRLGDREPEDPDARHPSGRPIEIKSAARSIGNGSSSRSGRFYFRERAHRELLDSGGDYALAVYDLDAEVEEIAEVGSETIEILSIMIVPARFVDPLIGSWSSVDRPGERAVAKLSHSSVPMLPEGSA